MANERLKAFLKSQATKGPGGSGERTQFYKKVNGTQVVRLFTFQYAATGETEICFQYFNHYGQKKVCPRTFDPDAHCDICAQVDLLFEEGSKSSKEQAYNLKAKKQTWFTGVLQGDKQFQLLDLPFGAVQKLWLVMALSGGWNKPEAKWDDPVFETAFEKGLAKVFGPKGHDVIWTFNKSSPDKGKMHSFSVSERPGKDLSGLGEAPDIHTLFLKIKKVGNDTVDSEPSVPEEKEPEPKPEPEPKKVKKPLKKAAPRKPVSRKKK